MDKAKIRRKGNGKTLDITTLPLQNARTKTVATVGPASRAHPGAVAVIVHRGQRKNIFPSRDFDIRTEPAQMSHSVCRYNRNTVLLRLGDRHVNDPPCSHMATLRTSL